MLAAFTHPSHIVIYAPGDSFTCRRAATRNLLGITNVVDQLSPRHEADFISALWDNSAPVVWQRIQWHFLIQ
ncbi:hypothetical protein B5C26_05240 [Photorhabdus luminescens]|nr:hypothetical protein B5C26_05240 [Photorhabdus luminescens]